MFPRTLKTLLAFLLILSTAYSGYAQPGPITLSFAAPASSQPVDSAFSVTVYCASQTSFAITSVVATLQGRNTALTSSAQWYYSGIISLAGLPKDSAYTLSVVAKDAGGDSIVISEPVIYDPPPVVTLIKPVWGAVARPMLDIKAACAATGGHCQLAVQLFDGTTKIPVGTFTDSVSTAVDVSAHEGSWNLQVQVSGTDQFGAAGSIASAVFYVETSPFLTPLYTASCPILDFSGNRVLVTSLSFTDSPRIVDYTTGLITAVPFSGIIPNGNNAALSPTGMVFLGQRKSQGVPIFFDWNNGNLDSLGTSYGPGSFKVNGGYCTYNAGQNILLRNLNSRSTQAIGTGTWNDLSASGAIAYTDAGLISDSALLYHNGGTTIVQSLLQSPILLSNPITDGSNVAYAEQDNSGNKTIYRYDAKAGTSTLLASLGNASQNPEISNIPFYRLTNGYTAYIQLDANSRYQAWIRDTLGNSSQVSFFSQSAYLETLAPNGQLSFFNNTTNINGVRYIYDKTIGTTPVSSNYNAIPYYQNGNWYLVVGNTLFGVNLQISPDKADSFAVNVKEDSAYSLSLHDFASHYQTSGSLMSVIISKIPAHGTIKLDGVPVTNNQSIPRTSLAALVYTPALNFVGSDTVVWTGSNGFTASPTNALLVINVDSVIPVLPPAPQIAGLDSGYCANGGAEQFHVTNMPFAGTGTAVAATLDGQQISIQANGNMSMNIWQMPVGSHSIAVTFSNSVGSDSTVANFQIIPSSTPVLNVAAGPATISDTTNQVVVTATAVSGGGTAPQFAFAGDRYFTQIIQAQSTSNTLTIPVSSLPADSNIVYVQMTTSDTCNTTPVVIDSVLVINPKGAHTAAPGDSTGTGGPIVAGPNPFTGQLTVRGLDPTKSYAITLVNGMGQIAVTQAVQGQNQSILTTSGLPNGIYFLRVYNSQGYLVASSQEILKLMY